MERTKLGEFAWADLQAVDRAKQSPFYEQLFGWTYQEMPTGQGGPDYRMYQLGGEMVAAANQLPADAVAAGMTSFWAIYVATPDVAATLAKAEEAGGKTIMPVMDVLDSGRIGAFEDPQGAQIFLWEKVTFAGAGMFMEPGTIGWADLATEDPEGAIGFYTKVFGWNVKELPGMGYWQLEVDGVGQGGIGRSPSPLPDGRAFWKVYFMTDDIQASVAKAQELGGTLVGEIQVIPNMLSQAMLTDPEGAIFALLEPVMP